MHTLASRLLLGPEQLVEQMGDGVLTPCGVEYDGTEGELYQVRNRSFQDPLNFPPKLVERISGLNSVVANVDGRPTAQSREVFRMFAPQIAQQLVALREVWARDLPAVNAAFRAVNGAAVRPKAAELRPPSPEKP